MTVKIFPPADGVSLAGERCSFPRDFVTQETIALVAFDLKARADVESWVPFIDRFARDGTAGGRLFPVLPRAMRMLERVIVATMRKDATTVEARAATVPLFVDIDAFCAALDIADRAAVHVFVVASDGSVVARTAGPYSDAAGRTIAAAIKEQV